MRLDNIPFTTICWGVLLGILGSVAFLSLRDWRNFKGSFLYKREDFSITEGKIIGSSGYTSNDRKKILYHYRIEYEYTVNGKVHHNDKVTFTSNSSANISYAQNYLGTYPMGKTIQVFYDPNDPSFSVLEPDKTSTYLLVFTLIFSIIVGLIIIVVSWIIQRARKPKRARQK